MSYKPDNMPYLSPYMVVRDIEKSIEFYQKAFNFEIDEMMKGKDGAPQHVSMKKGEIIIMFCQEGAFGIDKKSPATQKVKMPINMYVYCENVDSLYEQAISNGAKKVMEPQDSFWGDRFCSVLDPDHYEWNFASLIR